MARKKQRETYGNGSIVQEHRNGEPLRDTWRVCLTLGTETYTDKEGRTRKRQRKVQRTVHGSLADARKVCKKLSEEYEHVDLDAAKMTFAEACEAWEGSMQVARTCQPQRLHDYMRRLSYVSECLGSKPLAEVKQKDVEAALATIKACRNLSQRSLREVFALTKRVFRYAVANGMAVRNPCDGMTAPKVQRVTDRRALDYEECRRLKTALDEGERAMFAHLADKERKAAHSGHMQGRAYSASVSDASGLVAARLMLATGMRRGEALALTWEHVDFTACDVKVVQAITAQGEVKPPKSAAGVRAIPVDLDTMSHLRAWKRQQEAALARVVDALGEPFAQTKATPVCCDGCGGWLNPSNFSRWWREYSASIGFAGLRAHELRHTYASMLLENGEAIKTAQTLLGHASAALTLDTYGHKINTASRLSADIMAAAMEGEQLRKARVIPFEKTA